MELNYLSIDIGGTNIKTAMIDRSGTINSQNRLKTPTSEAAFFRVLDNEIADVLERIRGIAISCPGKIDPNNGTVFYGGSLPFLDGIPLKERLERKFNLPVAVINDGKAAALSELWLGNLHQINYGAAITLGTGLGGGIIIDGNLVQGGHYQAGEFSFMLKPTALPDIKSLYGFSGSAVALIKRCSEKLHLAEVTKGEVVFEELNKKNPIIYPLFQEFCQEIAYIIINLQAILDVERVVIGGGISAQNLVIDEIQTQYLTIRNSIPILNDSIQKIEIIACKYRNEANLLGALYQLLLDVDQKYQSAV